MKGKELQNLGIPRGEKVKLAMKSIAKARQQGCQKSDLRGHLTQIIASPKDHLDHPYFAELAFALSQGPKENEFIERKQPAPWKQWGSDLDSGAIDQMKNACRLPIAVSGALMPDAHQGYGLPIGGVLGTKNTIIPYAVGVDIACRMKMTVFDIPPQALRGEKSRLIKTLERETRFGIGAHFRDPHDHPVMDLDWDISPITKKAKQKARAQLGSSGSGNHFVEFGILKLSQDELGLKAGKYLTLLSHSGSRGPGAAVANYYSKLARERHPELPKELKHLAWLDLDKEDGQEYWAAMSLMGEYAAANHSVIHREITKALHAKCLTEIENHHNFAWKEEHNQQELIVHRKGATPAGKEVLGIIPGSMATPGFVVRGKGDATSLCSASHGAGRVMSRTKAKQSFTWSEIKKRLEASGIELLSAGLDESPGVYKDIHQVMDAQQDLVDVIARFDPKIVKMAPAGEKPED